VSGKGTDAAVKAPRKHRSNQRLWVIRQRRKLRCVCSRTRALNSKVAEIEAGGEGGGGEVARAGRERGSAGREPVGENARPST